jgi:hypothetical protein
VPPTRSGGGQFGFLSLLLLGFAGLLRIRNFPSANPERNSQPATSQIPRQTTKPN